ncbi:MAG: hypothetical protein R3D88_06845 [Alphaproteobacteria bacterium]|nr:hypothetical protein [Alphaproteobacteria bacterium]
MKTLVLTPQIAAFLAYKKAKEASDAHRRTFNDFSYAERGFFGHKMARFIGQKSRTVLASLKNNISGMTSFVVEELTLAAQDALTALNAIKSSHIAAPAPYTPKIQTVHLDYEFDRVSTQVAAAVEFQIDYQLEDVTRVQDGSFIGPLRPEMSALKEAFDAGQVNDYEFQREALFLRGINFSQQYDQYAVSEDVIKTLRSAFGGGLQSTPVLVFRQAAQQVVHTPAPRIVQNYVPELKPAYA